MVSSSYAVVWRRAHEPVCPGALTLGRSSLRLDGSTSSGDHVILDVPYADIRSVRIGRAPDERIGASSSVLVATADGPPELAIGSTGGVGIVREIAERLDELVAAQGP
jgi:hypothetical protein